MIKALYVNSWEKEMFHLSWLSFSFQMLRYVNEKNQNFFRLLPLNISSGLNNQFKNAFAFVNNYDLK